MSSCKVWPSAPPGVKTTVLNTHKQLLLAESDQKHWLVLSHDCWAPDLSLSIHTGTGMRSSRQERHHFAERLDCSLIILAGTLAIVAGGLVQLRQEAKEFCRSSAGQKALPLLWVHSSSCSRQRWCKAGVCRLLQPCRLLSMHGATAGLGGFMRQTGLLISEA